MKIYTKFGDTGQTALFDGSRVPKSHLRIDTYGTLDELNSHLGLAIAHCPDPPLAQQLTALQIDLFTLSSDLATPAGSKNESKITRTPPEAITALEQQIDEATAQLPPLKRFILPGGTPTAARLHVARTICRRAERLLTALLAAEQNTPHEPALHTPLIYLNRLSDLLFTLARLANKREGRPDVEWDAGDPRKKSPGPT
jgi:cob(I)alamin adenosyltransferase